VIPIDPEKTAEWRRRMLEFCEPDIVTADDGYKVFWPTKNNGYYGAYLLRIIADELDKRNEQWDLEVAAYHRNSENDE
jgi:hypothetical protein